MGARNISMVISAHVTVDPVRAEILPGADSPAAGPLAPHG